MALVSQESDETFISIIIRGVFYTLLFLKENYISSNKELKFIN